MLNYPIKAISVQNEKGGVGKTTTAAILAEFAHLRLGLNVLCVDLDPQCNLSRHYIKYEETPDGREIPPILEDWEEGDDEDPDGPITQRSNIADIFLTHCTVQPRATGFEMDNDTGPAGGIDIVIAHPEELNRVNTEWSNQSGEIQGKIINRLNQAIQTEDAANYYDLIIIDTGPGRTPLFRSALRCATHSIIPFIPEEKSLQGIGLMVQTMRNEIINRDSETQLELLGLLPNMVDFSRKSKIHQPVLEEVEKTFASMLLPSSAWLPNSSDIPGRDMKEAAPKSIFDMPRRKARLASESLGIAVFSKVFKDNEDILAALGALRRELDTFTADDLEELTP